MKYKKDLSIILPIEQKLSITYTKEKIIINNFSNIYDIKDDLIIIDDYQIIGNFLKVTSIENRCLEIVGTIKEIKIL